MALDPLQTLLEDIKALKARYFLALDGKDAAAYADTFGEDGVFDIRRFDITKIEAGDVAPGPVLEGGRKIAEFVLGSLTGIQTSHRAFMPLIEILSADEAKGTWTMEDWLRLPGGALQLAGFGYYHDLYRRRDDVWRIARSELIRWS